MSTTANPLHHSLAVLMMALAANYLAWLLRLPDAVRTLCVGVAMAALLVQCVQRVRARDYGALALIILSFLLVWADPLSAWDARSIWFFHAKRMFFDGAIQARFDHYAEFSHNAYPSIVPAMAASLTRAVGIWNELLPKTVLPLFFLPPLLLLWDAIADPLGRCWLLVLALFHGGTLTCGEMDALLAFCLATLVVQAAANRGQLLPILPTFPIMAVLASLKNEGFVLAVLFSGMYVLWTLVTRTPWHRRYAQYAGCFALSVAPMILWKFQCYSHDVSESTITAGSGFFQTLATRINLHDLLLILQYTVPYILLPGMLLVAVWFRRREHRATLLLVVSLLAAYDAVLWMVYLTTPYDLGWHLSTSISRVTLSLSVPAIVYALWSFQAPGRKTPPFKKDPK